MNDLLRPRTVSWFSAGAASAVATMLTLNEDDSALVAYCETGGEHPDNDRFIADCERLFDRKVERLRSEKYASTWDVWEQRRYLAGIDGAPCTVELKIAPRIAWQMPKDVHVFGYTSDGPDVERAKRLRENYFELAIETPLIKHGLTKSACLHIVEKSGIALPILYGLGFPNNNCIPCVKATSPNYWALVRKTFPREFERMVNLSRELGARLCRINDERRFIDEIPEDWPTTQPMVPSCDFLCHLVEQDLAPVFSGAA